MTERRFRRDFASLDDIFAFIRDFLSSRGIDERHAYDVDLMAEELFTNMVKYGGGGGEGIEIALGWERPTLTLRLRDFGAADWDVTRANPVDIEAPLQERRAGGLGLYLVRQIADRVEYAHEDHNSTITVTKRLES
jgi:serine/threonine-protein kinase RsbW